MGGGGVILYTIVAQLHLHTKSGKAACVPMIVHVSAQLCTCVCGKSKQVNRGNKAMTPRLTHWIKGATSV